MSDGRSTAFFSPPADARNAGPNPYLRTQVMTAAPEELRLLLFDGAIRFTQMARDGLADQNPERAYEGITRAQAILMELINSLRPEHDPELCQNLSALYTFMYARLVDAGTERDAAMVDEVLELLQFERHTWVMVMDKLIESNRESSEIQSLGTGTTSISVQG